MKKDKTADKHRSKKSSLLSVVLVILAAITALCTLTKLFFNDPSVGYFSTPDGRKIYMEAYDQAMSTIAAPTATHDIETSWGSVRVYECSSEENKDTLPVVLLPGYRSGTPMWQLNIPAFSKQRKTYAMDALGDTGKSKQSVPLKEINNVTSWISEALFNLSVERAHIYCGSFVWRGPCCPFCTRLSRTGTDINPA